MGTEEEALVGASNRFVAFFRELGETFIEREDVLAQLALALLAREHVLMTGPPGTAKRKLAQAVLGRIISEDTGKPSLFARQFTESTVQTDLVGPINFKTLMETGRTEHFTDEGLLGAAHAFLDEMFDGRDMLLRSTLNLLHERELKQGTKIASGKIGCAVMTTNRYLCEVLENERLLAFVDRIAFLSFVPKGFAWPEALAEVLQRQVAGRTRPPPHTPLTVQDVDLLQTAVDDVFISDGMCDLVATLARAFDAALAGARKADPAFTPSRYISTRGVVRLGGLLRAACFYDWAFNDRARPLEARPGDLGRLRLALTLSGPSLEDSARLLEQESDPRERRQLGIVRTERAIFERCLTDLDVRRLPPPPPPVDARLLESCSAAALARKGIDELTALARDLATVADRRHPDAARARAGLAATLQALVDRALRAGLAPGADDKTSPGDDPAASAPDPVAAIAELGKLADKLDTTSAAHRQAARWLRGKALARLAEIAALGGNPFAAGVQHQQAADGDVEAMRAVAVAHLARATDLHALRAALRHAGAEEPDPAADDNAWAQGLERVARRLGPALAAGLTAARDRAHAQHPGVRLAVLLGAVEPALAVVRDAADKLTALGGDGRALLLTGARGAMEQLVHTAWKGLEPEPRAALARGLGRNLAALGDAGVLPLLPAPLLGRWMAEAIVRAETAPPPRVLRAQETSGYRGYRNLRSQMPESTLALTLVELLSAVPALWQGEAGGDPDRMLLRLAELVRGFPDGLRAELVLRDQAYIADPVAHLERWWQALTFDLPDDPGAALDRLRNSGFFAITHDECALHRFDLEARLVATVFEGAEVHALRARLSALARQSGELVDRLTSARPPGPRELEKAAAAPSRPHEPVNP